MRRVQALSLMSFNTSWDPGKQLVLRQLPSSLVLITLKNYLNCKWLGFGNEYGSLFEGMCGAHILLNLAERLSIKGFIIYQ